MLQNVCVLGGGGGGIKILELYSFFVPCCVSLPLPMVSPSLLSRSLLGGCVCFKQSMAVDHVCHEVDRWMQVQVFWFY